jgi:hypothetical protein
MMAPPLLLSALGLGCRKRCIFLKLSAAPEMY